MHKIYASNEESDPEQAHDEPSFKIPTVSLPIL